MLASLGLLLFLISCVQGQHAISFHNDVIYIYSNFKNTWIEALDKCITFYNANLVVIDTNQIQRDVQKVFKRITSKDDHYWIALHYTSSTAWTWPGNVSPLITHWKNGKRAGNASCAAIAVKGGFWIPFPCSTRKPYICYGKVQIQNTSQKYAVSQVKLRQHNAESVCTQGNRTLATILSMQDEQVIENSIAMDNHSDYYIGLKAKAGQYMWSNGANLTDGKDYTNWGTGYPNASLGECVVLSKNGSGIWKWRNMECETITHKFICQKPTMSTSTTVLPTTQETETSTAKMKESTAAAATKMIASTVGSMHETTSGGNDQRPEAIFIFCTMFLTFSMLLI